MQDNREKAFKRLHVNAFEKQCDSGLCALKYQIHDLMVECLQKFAKLCGLDNSPYQHFYFHIKHVYRRNSKRRKHG